MSESIGAPLKAVGVVDLDTSHPQAWLPILRDLGYSIVGVFDGGTVYPPEYAQQYASKNDIPHVFDSVDAMAAHPDVQIAIVHSCNWDLHVQRSAPFVARGKAVLVDKPIAGNLADLKQFGSWIDGGARIAGGSSLRYAREIWAFHDKAAGTAQARAVFAGCGVDEFNYGIHTYAMVAGMLGPGMVSARAMGIRHGLHQVELAGATACSAMLLYRRRGVAALLCDRHPRAVGRAPRGRASSFVSRGCWNRSCPI